MTIGFNYLGMMGRLGNQLFQYAALRGIAAQHGYEFAIPLSNYKDPYRDHQLFAGFQLPGLRKIQIVAGPPIKSTHFHFDVDLFEHMPDNANLVGYFQTEKYFKHIAAEIRRDLQFKPQILAHCQTLLSSVPAPQPIAIHVRRGDYVTSAQQFDPCSMQYYQQALQHFAPERPVIVFSDDIAWCKQQFLGPRFIFPENTNNLTDLCLMSLCDDFIIANSSFSWWGAWLANNPNKTVIAPKRWFNEEFRRQRQLNSDDIYCEGWIKLDL